MPGPMPKDDRDALPGAIDNGDDIVRVDDLIEVVDVRFIDDDRPAEARGKATVPHPSIPTFLTNDEAKDTPGSGISPAENEARAYVYGPEPSLTRENLLTLARIMRRTLRIAAHAVASELSQNTSFTVARAGISPYPDMFNYTIEGRTIQAVMLEPAMGPVFIIVDGENAISKRCARRVDGRVDCFIAGVIAGALPAGWKGVAALEAALSADSMKMVRSIPFDARVAIIEVSASIGEAKSVMYAAFPLAALATVVDFLTGAHFEGGADTLRAQVP